MRCEIDTFVYKSALKNCGPRNLTKVKKEISLYIIQGFIKQLPLITIVVFC